MAEGWWTEIQELHEFFQGWFGGRPPEASFARVTGVLGKDFVLVSPSGRTVDRDALLEGIRQARGSQPGLRIWIEKAKVQAAWTGWVVASYEEWQERDGKRTARSSVALFRERSGTSNGVEWLYLHEAWLDPATGSSSA